MSYSIEMLPGEPILYVVWSEDFPMDVELKESTDRNVEILDVQPEPVFFIINLLDFKFSISDLMAASNIAGYGETPIFHHPNIRQVVFVTDSKMVKLGAKGMNSDIFGNVDIKAFGTEGAALEFCRSQVAEVFN